MKNREQIYGQEAAGLLRQMLLAGFPAEHALESLNSLLTSSCAYILARRTSLRICCAIWSGSSVYSITLTGIAMETSLPAAKMKN